ncbi:hypothetical protein OAO87_00555 [bacterium]|nr:hypothetical protein [bacterium]
MPTFSRFPGAAGCSTANHSPLVGSGVLAGAGTRLKKAVFVSVISAGRLSHHDLAAGLSLAG